MNSSNENETFYIVFRWMTDEFGLKGNELSVYAIIYGFSRAGQPFQKSQNFLADFVGVDKRNISKILGRLVKKWLLKKIDRFENNVKFCGYIAVTR